MHWEISTRTPCTSKWETILSTGCKSINPAQSQQLSHPSGCTPNIAQASVCLLWALYEIRKNRLYLDVQTAVCSVHQASSWIWDCLFSASSNAQLRGGFWKLQHIQCYCRHGLQRCISGDSLCHADHEVYHRNDWMCEELRCIASYEAIWLALQQTDRSGLSPLSVP